MKIASYIPSQLLSPFIRSYLVIETSVGMLNRVLPDTSITLAFQLKGQVDYLINDILCPVPTACVAGLRKSARQIHYRKETATLIVVFHEGGARAFFPQPLNELFDESLPLEDLIGIRSTRLIEDQLREAETHPQRITIVETFLLSRLSEGYPDKSISTTIQKILFSKGQIRMDGLGGSIHMSTDAFEKRFRKTVGTTPKQFARIVRMKSVIHEQQHNRRLTDTALNAGYFDQPHFNKDFKLFTGLTPTDFFNGGPSW